MYKTEHEPHLIALLTGTEIVLKQPYKAIKYAPFGRPTLASSRGLWQRYAKQKIKGDDSETIFIDLPVTFNWMWV